VQKNPPRSARQLNLPSLLLGLVLLGAPLALASPSLAGEPADAIEAEGLDRIGLSPEAPTPEGFTPASLNQPPADRDPAAANTVRERDEASTLDDSMLNPNAYDAQRAETHPFARLGLFAGSRGFRMGREDPVYDVEGGASFRFLENFFLTGSYRILDYQLDAESFSIENAGPLFGVRLRF
jgi:hypothetical protein